MREAFRLVVFLGSIVGFFSLLALVGCKDCEKAKAAVEVACSVGSAEACQLAKEQYAKGCPVVEPTPEPPPTTTTTTTTLPPVVTPPTTLPPVTQPQPPNPSVVCGPLPAGAVVYLNDKPYGQGVDSTIRIKSASYCEAHGMPGLDCKVRQEGDPYRDLCERYYAGGCPVWQYRLAGDSTLRACLQPAAEFSCDHFGNPEYRDDPNTPDVFEGEPKACGLQRDDAGNPKAGFFVIAHGNGQVRACRPDYDGCGPWVSVNH
jgi:hypothetical protein